MDIYLFIGGVLNGQLKEIEYVPIVQALQKQQMTPKIEEIECSKLPTSCIDTYVAVSLMPVKDCIVYKLDKLSSVEVCQLLIKNYKPNVTT